MKRLLTLFLIVALGLTTWTGCGQNKEAASQSDSSAANKHTEGAAEIRVGMLSIDDVLPLVVAQKDGLFEKHGVKVKLYPFKSSSDQSKAFEAGELDVVMNDMVVQSLMKKGGTDTKVVAMAFGATPKEGRFVVVSSPNSNITKPKDLEGHTVAISTNTMMDYLLSSYEKYLKLDADRIKTVNIPDLVLRMETVIAGKDVDAAILPDPLASMAIKEGCHAVIDDTQLNENFSQSVILAQQAIIDKHPQELQKFLDAYFEAMTKINEHPEDYRALAIENGRVPKPLQANYVVPTYTPKSIPSKDDVKRVNDWLVARGLLDKPYQYTDLVDKAFLK